ncbi:MAG: helix-turn-helix transcriptional regulator [Clostridium butyricum]|uniref:helix-turn-helix domain-containing protein n=1 Tax=Clostridium sp. TaxID=1506 RepID=UPI00290445BE|nr:helix-turn-helix transcriptional regulator [Clostridium sp.]MDU1116768.1 helix-turn-helix transcriptional regulator [Clostridium sp.]MDU7712747.1 helix-turn-helix transcriptional regulator [Clostridium butyricum]
MLTSEMIGERIKKLREQKKISQQSMVNELKRLSINMSRETLSKIENGNRTVSAVELKGISSVLSIDVEDILKDDEDNGLVTLFRNRNMKEETIEKVEYLQDMIISFINQKKIAQSDAKKNVTPLWRD